MALRIFHEQIKQRGEKLVRYPPAPPRDLSPPQQVRHYMLVERWGRRRRVLLAGRALPAG